MGGFPYCLKMFEVFLLRLQRLSTILHQSQHFLHPYALDNFQERCAWVVTGRSPTPPGARSEKVFSAPSVWLWVQPPQHSSPPLRNHRAKSKLTLLPIACQAVDRELRSAGDRSARTRSIAVTSSSPRLVHGRMGGVSGSQIFLTPADLRK